MKLDTGRRGGSCSQPNLDRVGGPSPIHEFINPESGTKTNSAEPTEGDGPPELRHPDEWEDAVEWVADNGDYSEKKYGFGARGGARDDMEQWRLEKGEEAMLAAIERAREKGLFSRNLHDFLKKTYSQKRRRSGD